jgi:hypothetical protein
MIPEDVKIEVFPIDDRGPEADFLYCAIVLGYSEKQSADDVAGWYNLGIVVREKTAVEAFQKAMNIAICRGYWE